MPLSSMPQVVCCRAVVYQGKNRALPVSTEGPLSARAKRMKYEIGEEGTEGGHQKADPLPDALSDGQNSIKSTLAPKPKCVS